MVPFAGIKVLDLHPDRPPPRLEASSRCHPNATISGRAPLRLVRAAVHRVADRPLRAHRGSSTRSSSPGSARPSSTGRPRAASSSRTGRSSGSSLIGQPFTDSGYFWSRPSATSPYPYNAAASSGSNLGPTNPALLQAIADRIAALRAADPGNTAPVPDRPGHRLRQRPRSRHQPGRRGVPGGAGRPSTRDHGGYRERLWSRSTLRAVNSVFWESRG